MQPRIQELLDHITGARQELRDAVDSVPVDHRQARPTPDAWSVAEVLEHLAVVETNVARMLSKKIAEGREAGLGVETESSSVVNPRHVATMRDRSRRIETGDATRPTSSLSASAAWEAAESARATMRQVMIDSDGLALAEISAPHRIFGPLNVYEWIAFIGNHESRHAAQIREIGSSLNGRSD
jgi:uncharacterized damage-inducible protein DinB